MMRAARGGSVSSKPVNPATLRRVARCFRPYTRTVVWTFAMVLLSVVAGLLPPWFIQIIIDQGLQHNRLDITARYSIYTLLATLIGAALTLYYGYLSVMVGQRIMVDLRNQLYEHLQGMSLRFFTATRTGEIQSRLISDVSGVHSVVGDTASNVLSNLATVLSTLVAMLYFDWRLTLLTIVVVPLFAFMGQRMGAYARGVRKGTQEQTANLNAFMQETLSVSGVLLTKTTGRRQTVIGRFYQENEALSSWQIKAQMIMYFFMGMIRLITSLVPAGVYWLAGWIISGGDHSITIGTLVAFTALQGRMFFPLTSLMNVQVEVTGALALFDRIFEYLDLPQDIVDAPDAVTMQPAEVKGRVAFEHVTFRYDPSSAEPTLSDVTFVAEPGQLIALVGASGAGKTTLTYLIPRLYDADEGVVTIDGVDVRKIALDSLGSFVGAVTQETYLVHASIRENLKYARPDATDEEIVEASKAAAIHDHIAGLPEGYDTIVGERGYKLSGGEKQRVAIARAILKNPRVLILDEATSALDTHSERLIQAALGKLTVGRTTFAIAHRLSTILAADLILVLDRGKIVERGGHDELLSLGGAYAKLYRQQFLSEHSEPAEA